MQEITTNLWCFFIPQYFRTQRMARLSKYIPQPQALRRISREGGSVFTIRKSYISISALFYVFVHKYYISIFALFLVFVDKYL